MAKKKQKTKNIHTHSNELRAQFYLVGKSAGRELVLQCGLIFGQPWKE